MKTDRVQVPWLLACAFLAGCAASSTDEDTSDTDTNAGWDGSVEVDPCGFADTAAGVIDVSERFDIFHDTVYSRISAILKDAPVPSFHYVFEEAGACRYLKAEHASCEPVCAQDAICTADGRCVTNPKTVSGGMLTIQGLGDSISIQAEDYSPGTYNGPSGLPADLFSAGDPIGAVLSGEVHPATSLGARGVAVMDRDLSDNVFEMVDGQDAEITWTPGPDPSACIQAMLYSYNEVHGAPLPAIIWCEGTDTGSLIIPQRFVETFPSGMTPEVTSGYDWPHSELTRYTASTKAVPQGLTRLMVRSTTYFLLSHPESTQPEPGHSK